MKDDELSFAELDKVTGAKNFVSEEECSEIYRNFSSERAKQIIALKNEKAVAEQIVNTYAVAQEQNSTEEKRNSM